MRGLSIGLVMFVTGCLIGCAALAKKTPTPAAKLTRADITPPQPGERYYVMIFGSQTTPKRPALTHTWAVAVRTIEVPGCDVPQIQDSHIISWMPRSMTIKTYANRVEPGVNLGLHETLAWAFSTGQHVSLWGPYECTKLLFHRFEVQEAYLNSGAVGYQCIDSFGEAARKGNGSDCYHAVSDIDPLYDRSQYPLASYGETASHRIAWMVVSRTERTLGPARSHHELLPQLGLDRYPMRLRPVPQRAWLEW